MGYAAMLAFDAPHSIGQIGGGKQRTNGVVDIATVQTVMIDEHWGLLATYGALILDGCHHHRHPQLTRPSCAPVPHGIDWA